MKKRVLLVDDEEVFTKLLKLNLEQTGSYEVLVENWSGGALPTAKTYKPDVILMDVIMPQMFGGDVAAQIRADPQLTHVPIIFLSATLSKSRVQAHNGVIGGYPFLAKPATLEAIIAAIERETNPDTRTDIDK